MASTATTWSEIALNACLSTLRDPDSGWPIQGIVVLAAWTDGPEALCVVYRPPFDWDRRVGLRRTKADSASSGRSRRSTLDAFPGDAYIDNPADPNPVQFGETVAKLDISEPLGNFVNILKMASDGVQWWGTLGSDLPDPDNPDSELYPIPPISDGGGNGTLNAYRMLDLPTCKTWLEGGANR